MDKLEIEKKELEIKTLWQRHKELEDEKQLQIDTLLKQPALSETIDFVASITTIENTQKEILKMITTTEGEIYAARTQSEPE